MGGGLACLENWLLTYRRGCDILYVSIMGNPRLEVLGREVKYKYNGFRADVDTKEKRFYLVNTHRYCSSMFIDFKDIDNVIDFLNMIRERIEDE